VIAQGSLFVESGEAVRRYEPVEPVIERNPEHLARRSDPVSSVEAARGAVESGAVVTHADAIEQMLERHPWIDSLELVVWEAEELRRLGIDRTEVSRRLSGLLEAGRAIRMEPPSRTDPDVGNPSLLPCRASHLKAQRLCRWARPRHAELAHRVLADPEARPRIDWGRHHEGGRAA
jgi:hypothetical protein